ncbi:DUF3108 domain-containing protein [Colwellia psychrerythraea]|uniref:DUF3108 domain-containing protein n=1 Tax=Colwellia psychrerythraea TaxID=28229 RepID=UPI001E2BF02B|nr:DUF3108 domain-containing protein [Colwellia psychrerythraea]
MSRSCIVIKKSLTLLIILCCCLLAKSQANTFNKLTTEEIKKYHQCEKKFEYDVSFLGGNVGHFQRTITWHKSATSIKATVKSQGEVSFLWLDSTYLQTSTMHYSPQYKHFLTPGFSQKLTGMKAREMKVEMSNNGHSSTVSLNAEVIHYDNENLPLYDIDTLGAQVRLNLLQGKTHFKLSRQASNKIDSYQFEVVGTEVINHKKWGMLTSIKVVEVGKHKDMAMWFSAKHDHQMIMAELDMIFSPVVWLTHFSKQCQ